MAEQKERRQALAAAHDETESLVGVSVKNPKKSRSVIRTEAKCNSRVSGQRIDKASIKNLDTETIHIEIDIGADEQTKVDETNKLQMKQTMDETNKLQMKQTMDETYKLQMKQTMDETNKLQMKQTMDETNKQAMDQEKQETITRNEIESGRETRSEIESRSEIVETKEKQETRNEIETESKTETRSETETRNAAESETETRNEKETRNERKTKNETRSESKCRNEPKSESESRNESETKTNHETWTRTETTMYNYSANVNKFSTKDITGFLNQIKNNDAMRCETPIKLNKQVYKKLQVECARNLKAKASVKHQTISMKKTKNENLSQSNNLEISSEKEKKTFQAMKQIHLAVELIERSQKCQVKLMYTKKSAFHYQLMYKNKSNENLNNCLNKTLGNGKCD